MLQISLRKLKRYASGLCLPRYKLDCLLQVFLPFFFNKKKGKLRRLLTPRKQSHSATSTTSLRNGCFATCTIILVATTCKCRPIDYSISQSYDHGARRFYTSKWAVRPACGTSTNTHDLCSLSLTYPPSPPFVLGSSDTLKLTFHILEKETGKGVQPHQTFLRFHDPQTDEEGVQPLRVSSTGKANFELVSFSCIGVSIHTPPFSFSVVPPTC